MSFRTMHFQSSSLMDFALNGGVVGGRLVLAGASRLFDMHDQTLIINGTTVTFDDSSGAGLTAAQLKAQIEDAVGGSLVSWVSGALGITHASGVTVGSAGTSNRVFGFSATTDTVSTVYAPPDGVAPRILFIGASPGSEGYAVTVEEA